MRLAQAGRPLDSESGKITICIICPEDDLDWAPVEFGLQAVMGYCRVDGRDPDGEVVESQLDMDRVTLTGEPERLFEAETLIKGYEDAYIVRVDIDGWVGEHAAK